MSRTINHAPKYNRDRWPRWKWWRVRVCGGDCGVCGKPQDRSERERRHRAALAEGRRIVNGESAVDELEVA